jgi:hypothetical protein
MISAMGRRPGHRRAHGRAEDGLFGDRRVAHAQRAELLVEPDSRLEHAAGLGTSSPRNTTLLSRSISCAMPRATASR